MQLGEYEDEYCHLCNYLLLFFIWYLLDLSILDIKAISKGNIKGHFEIIDLF